MVDGGDCDYIVANPNMGFVGETVVCECGKEKVLAPLTHENANALRKAYPFTAPSRVLERDKTMGVGDRLGIATDGHLRVFSTYNEITPILAQQSIRELNLTNRTFHDVIDSATFAVFRCNYTTGWGADGDHVKAASEVQYALESGATMITLDCSEHIDNSIESLSSKEVNEKYEAIRGAKTAELEGLYLNKTFDVEGTAITFDEDLFKRTVLIYVKAIDHAVNIFKTLIMKDGKQVADFEVSIDETLTPTVPAQHFFVANELVRYGVHIATVAPRFCGEFQKGIDYIGNLDQFAAEMKLHAAISRKFGYKISIHSGSDKFSAFPSAGKETQGRFHLKTAGTNWLEAMKLVSIKDGKLYREIHKYALNYAFAEASKYYHVTTNLNNIPDVDTLTDEQLPELFNNNDSRQLIHITYGLILNHKDESGKFIFRDSLYKLWRENREGYYELLNNHIGRHAKAIL
ncbi:MAG: tagaturonate epimerase family protein, partial [Sphaerochaetaceae bacterium]|nr:tagaturonate epimerase family protein [Sphaerochaetaceae bacterium]